MNPPTSVPTKRALTYGSLFAGIGGIDLGLDRAGMVCKWQVEKDEYCRKVLAKHWPDVPKYEDVRNVGKENLPRVDLICGGFPCQDISVAGRRAGIVAGNRSGLWHEYARIVCELRPRYVLVENVTGILSDGMGIVLGELSSLGYNAEWSVVSACSVGASHPRARVFILAYANGLGLQGRLPQRAAFRAKELPQTSVRWDVSAPYVCGGADGIPNRAHRLRALGNSVVPQVSNNVGRWIVEADAALRSAAA